MAGWPDGPGAWLRLIARRDDGAFLRPIERHHHNVDAPGPPLRDDRERVDVLGPHSAEVPMIERRDRVEPEALSQGNEAGVKASERAVAVQLGQLRDAGPILGGQFLDGDLASRDRSVEGCFPPRVRGTCSGSNRSRR
jgi:hypothetical protein